MRSTKGTKVVLVACLAASACSSESMEVGVDGPVLRHNPLSPNGGNAAAIEGSLELEGDCLYVRSLDGDYRYPIVWPSGTTWDETQPSVVTPEGEQIAVGSTVSGGGGYFNLGHVEEIAGVEAHALAKSCVDNAYDEIAVVNNEEFGISPG